MIENVQDWPADLTESAYRLDGVDVWAVNADELADSGRVELHELSDDETYRFNRIKAPHIRRRSFAIRWALRRLLSHCTKIAPAELCISEGKHGKPELLPDSGQQRIQFNVSHSGDLGLIAVALDLPVGVDLELIRPLEHPRSFAKTVLSSREIQMFNLLAPKAQNEFLLRSWVAKEAALKASGLGLAVRPDQMTIAGAWENGGPFRVVAENNAKRQWTAAFFVPAPGFVGGIAFEGDIQLPQLRLISPTNAHQVLLRENS